MVRLEVGLQAQRGRLELGQVHGAVRGGHLEPALQARIDALEEVRAVRLRDGERLVGLEHPLHGLVQGLGRGHQVHGEALLGLADPVEADASHRVRVGGVGLLVRRGEQPRGDRQLAAAGLAHVQAHVDRLLQHHTGQRALGDELHAGPLRVLQELPDPGGVEVVEHDPRVRGVGLLGHQLPVDQPQRPLVGGVELGARVLELLPRQPALDPGALGAPLQGAQQHEQAAPGAQPVLAGPGRAPLLVHGAGGLGHQLHADRQRRLRGAHGRGLQSGQRLHDPAPVRGGGARGTQAGLAVVGTPRSTVAGGELLRGGDHGGEVGLGAAQGVVRAQADGPVADGGHMLAVRAHRAGALAVDRLPLHVHRVGALRLEVRGHRRLQPHAHPVGPRDRAGHLGGEQAGLGVEAHAAHPRGARVLEAAGCGGGPHHGTDRVRVDARRAGARLLGGHPSILGRSPGRGHRAEPGPGRRHRRDSPRLCRTRPLPKAPVPPLAWAA